jgi:prepilin-type N-terminal cleavage/methylation domain-containing protein
MIINNEIKINRNFKINNLRKLKKLKGFTLIEVMVSVSLFAMVMTLSLGAILSIIDGNKKAQAINSVANNLNFAVDSMVRDIKTGYSYTCTAGVFPLFNEGSNSNIPNGQNGCTGQETDSVSLVSTITGERRGVQYFREEDPITKMGKIMKKTQDKNGVQAEYPVTSPEVNVKTLRFVVNNPISDLYQGQPSVFLVIEGTSAVNPTEASDFKIQTFISQRNLNLPK